MKGYFYGMCSNNNLYRYNTKCYLCNFLKNSTKLSEEFSSKLLEKLQTQLNRFNIIGGEPIFLKGFNQHYKSFNEKIKNSKTNRR